MHERKIVPEVGDEFQCWHNKDFYLSLDSRHIKNGYDQKIKFPIIEIKKSYLTISLEGTPIKLGICKTLNVDFESLKNFDCQLIKKVRVCEWCKNI